MEKYLFGPHASQSELPLILFNLAILTGLRWNLKAVLICISLMSKEVEHLFKCFPAICKFSTEYLLFRSAPPF